MVTSLVVDFKLRDAKAQTVFLSRFKPLSEYSNTREPGTLSYELLSNRRVNNSLLLVGRFADESALTAHKQSSAYSEFFTWAGANTGDVVKADKPIVSFDMEPHDCVSITAGLAAVASAPDAAECVATSDSPERRYGSGVLVFCGSRPGNDPLYEAHAREIGELIAASKRPLVYGGGSVGIMGAVAKAVQSIEGGRVIGVIPKALAPREISGAEIGNDIRFCDTMGDRKAIMFRESEFVISLPGGIGTLDELLEVFTLYHLNCYRPAVGLLDSDGFYQPFLTMLRHLISKGFLEERMLEMFVVAPTPKELWQKLMTFERPPSIAATLVWPKI